MCTTIMCNSLCPSGGQDSSAIQEVLRFVRKEKEVAVARLELAEQEGSRWRHKADLLQNQVFQSTPSPQIRLFRVL